MRSLIGVFAFIGIVSVTSAAHAQMCGGSSTTAGMCGTSQPAQAQSGQSAMPGMPGPGGMGGMMQRQSQPGQQGQGMMQDCPMMKQMAALQERVGHMEEMMRLGPQQQGTEPPKPQ